nr:hypothetical protein [Arthrobacter sp. BL-252-APC-1A]
MPNGQFRPALPFEDKTQPIMPGGRARFQLHGSGQEAFGFTQIVGPEKCIAELEIDPRVFPFTVSQNGPVYPGGGRPVLPLL